LTKKDFELIEHAKKVIQANYDETNDRHTVGAAVRCKNGRIFTGVNLHSLHGACAEQIALGTAITHGERDFTTIVAVKGGKDEKIIPPNGSGRQLLHDYAPNCKVILLVNDELHKIAAKKLLPFS
jgi:cyt_deam_tetra: cytidine deaminase